MRYWYQKPVASLNGYVRTILVLEGFSQADPARLPLFSNGMPALLCRTEKTNETEEQVVQLALFGKSISADCWEVGDKTTIIAYFFYPFVMSALFNVEAASLMKAPFELSNWNAHLFNALKAQLIYSPSTSRKLEIVDHLLIQQLEQQRCECEMVKYATDEIMYNPATTVLSSIMEKLNITERTFQRLFKKYVGVSAGQYRRICQFQGSFSQLRSREFEKLTDIAYDNGFADQSHFIRSFKEFAQVTPKGYLKSGLGEKNK